MDKFPSYFRTDECLDFRFIHEIKTKGYGVIDVNIFPRKLMRFLLLLTENYPVLGA